MCNVHVFSTDRNSVISGLFSKTKICRSKRKLRPVHCNKIILIITRNAPMCGSEDELLFCVLCELNSMFLQFLMSREAAASVAAVMTVVLEEPMAVSEVMVASAAEDVEEVAAVEVAVAVVEVATPMDSAVAMVASAVAVAQVDLVVVAAALLVVTILSRFRQVMFARSLVSPIS